MAGPRVGCCPFGQGRLPGRLPRGSSPASAARPTIVGVGTDGRRLLRGEEGGRVVVRRRRRGWDETQDEESAQGVALAINRPSDARAADIVALQRLAGNEAVVQLTGHAPGPEAEVNPPPGPYTGRRRRNDKMDWFEDNQNIFGPGTFSHYGAYPELWAPLAGLIDSYLVRNKGSEAGIRLATSDQRVAAWVIIERFNAQKAAAIRQEKAGKMRNIALLDAIWGEFGKQYGFAWNRCHAAWLQSNFRLKHEWLAVRFGRVQPPYAYRVKRKTGP